VCPGSAAVNVVSVHGLRVTVSLMVLMLKLLLICLLSVHVRGQPDVTGRNALGMERCVSPGSFVGRLWIL